MTDEQKNDIISYFEGKDLPKTMQVRDGFITDCKRFVDVQMLRLKEGVPLIKQCSFDHLMRFREELENNKTPGASLNQS